MRTVNEICEDKVSRKILNLLAGGWVPIKILVPQLGVDKHTAYRRFNALERHNLIEKSKRKHKSSRYRVLGYCLTDAGRILVEEDRSFPALNIKQTLHSFEHNYVVNAKLYIYPCSKAGMLKSKIVNHSLQMGLNTLLLELTRDENVVFGDSRLIFDCHIETIAEIDIFEFYNGCLSPSIRSYVKNRTFDSEKGLATRIQENLQYAQQLIKLTRFTANCYKTEIGKENLEIIEEALDKASKEIEDAKNSWAYTVSPLIINAYLFMFASIYHLKGELPEPEKYFELWYIAVHDLPKLKDLYRPLLEELKQKIVS